MTEAGEENGKGKSKLFVKNHIIEWVEVQRARPRGLANFNFTHPGVF